MKILHLDSNHPLLIEQLDTAGYHNIENYHGDREEVLEQIGDFEGVVIRSRLEIDREFIDAATKLRFVARVGAGVESIDLDYAQSKGIEVISAPEGNRNAVAEHALGMLLSLMNRLQIADAEVRNGLWNREQNRGFELSGKTVGIIGYGNMGKAFASKLSSFNCRVLCYDILPEIGDAHATQVSLETLFDEAEAVSLHTPWTPSTDKMVNAGFLANFKKPIWFINTARGKSVVTKDLVAALNSGQVLGAGLDVLEYEKSSFENLFSSEMPEELKELLGMRQVILSPHIAGWTVESKRKLAQTIVDKILNINA